MLQSLLDFARTQEELEEAKTVADFKIEFLFISWQNMFLPSLQPT